MYKIVFSLKRVESECWLDWERAFMAVLTHSAKSSWAPACPKLSLAEKKNQEFNSFCIFVLLSQNLHCIVILNLPTLINKKSWMQMQGKCTPSSDSAWPHRIDTYKNYQYATTSKDVGTKVVNKSILINWNILQVIKPGVTWKWN